MDHCEQCRRISGTSREIFTILVFALEFNIENMKLFQQRMVGGWLSDGWRMAGGWLADGCRMAGG